MSSDETEGLDPEQTPGVGTDGSLHSHHSHRDAEEHPGVGTDGSLHSHHTAEEHDHPGVGTDGSLHNPDE